MDPVKYNVGDKVLWKSKIRNLDDLEEQVWMGPYTVVKTFSDRQRYIIERNLKEEKVTVEEIKPYTSYCRPTTDSSVTVTKKYQLGDRIYVLCKKDNSHKVWEGPYTVIQTTKEHCMIKHNGKNLKVPLSNTKPYTDAVLQTAIPIVDKGDLCDKMYLAKGGFGEVFRMTHTKWGHVALKKLDNKYSSSNLSDARLLLSEAEYQWKLDHENILSLLGIVQQGSTCGSYLEISLVLEYAPYGSLYAFLRNKDVPIHDKVKLQILSGIAQAVKYLHGHDASKNRGVHCDLKPRNILIAENCVAKLGDFGLSKWLSGDGVQHFDILRTTPPGTPFYVPPESWNNPNMKPNEKFDVYSFGILMWAVLTVKEPYLDDLQGVHKSMRTEKIKQLIQEGHRPDSDLVTCRFANRMMTRCWEQQPENRPDFVGIADHLKAQMDRISIETKAEIETITTIWKIDQKPIKIQDVTKLATPEDAQNQIVPWDLLADMAISKSNSNLPHKMTIQELFSELENLAIRVHPKIEWIAKSFTKEEIRIGVRERYFSEVSSLIQKTLADVCEDVTKFIKMDKISSDHLDVYGRHSSCSQEEMAEIMLSAGMKVYSSGKAEFGTTTAVLEDRQHQHYVAAPAHIVGEGEELSIEDQNGNTCKLGPPVVRLVAAPAHIVGEGEELSIEDQHGNTCKLGPPVARLHVTPGRSKCMSKIPPLIDIALIEATPYPVREATSLTPVKVCDTSILEEGSLSTHSKQPWNVQKIGATTGHTIGNLVSYSKWHGSKLHGDAIMVDIAAEKGDSGAMIVTSGARECMAISYVFGRYTAQLEGAHGKDESVSWVVSLPFKPALDAMQKQINKKLTLYDGNIEENDGVDTSDMSVTMVPSKNATL